MAVEDVTEVKYVGPATKEILEQANIDAADILDRRVSHAQLVSIGVNPGVAARIRREHSLAWSHESGTDLDQRAEQVRGLEDGERSWVAASVGDTDTTDSGTTQIENDRDEPRAAESAWRDRDWPNESSERPNLEAEATWRAQSTPRSVTDVMEIGEEEQARLADAGITSIRSLRNSDPERVAESLGLSVERVTAWQEAAEDIE